ncbi:MAG: iron-sulfur cluster assembly scaffold protein [Candidatus Bipolaricaulota bacterium]|nr:iron-sulfur cluster assembly scaffold protein [Candidatus Bipolaricaulota bacterium]MBS3792214.1 iron-sulfur cluster assembly scaffold protein [Candidatus Bipolaricaulota bacterium]
MKDKPKIYNQDVLHHYQNPYNKGKLDDPDFSVTEENPNCGDRITLQLKLKGDEISKVKFDGHGCVLSIGAASILTQMVRGLSVGEASELTLDDLVDNMGNPPKMRRNCVSLSLDALKDALSEW